MKVIEVSENRYLNVNEIAHFLFDEATGSITIKTTKGSFFKVMTFTDYPDFHVWNSEGSKTLFKENMEKESVIGYLMSRAVKFIVDSLAKDDFIDVGEVEDFVIDALNDFFLEIDSQKRPSFPLND